MSVNTAPRIGFVSLGCPKNLTDSELILTQLSAEGYQTSKTFEGADLDDPAGANHRRRGWLDGLVLLHDRRLGAGRTIIFSSHMLGEVRQLCDRVVVLSRGEVKLNVAVGQAVAVFWAIEHHGSFAV